MGGIDWKPSSLPLGPMTSRQILVVGNGMVGQRLVDRLIKNDTTRRLSITIVGEEPRLAYDRVALTSWFEGRTEDDLCLVDPTLGSNPNVDYRIGLRVDSIDSTGRKVTLDDGAVLAYDDLVLATGSSPFVPPIPGNDLPGCFVYRTLDDVAAIKQWAEVAGRSTGLVIGGGLLGLEAANALRSLGLAVQVVEMAPYPMPQQLGEGAGRMLGSWVASLGVDLRCGVIPSCFEAGPDGAVNGLRLADGTVLDTNLVVFSAGVRPRDELARSIDAEIGSRGGVVVDDAMATSVPGVWAVGEVAVHRGQLYGLVAPGYQMAEVLADRLCGGSTFFEGSDLSTKLKLLGVGVASFGRANAVTVGDDREDGIDEVVYRDPVSRIFRRLVIDTSSGALLGGALVGDTSGYEILSSIALGHLPTPPELSALVLPERAGAAPAGSGSGAASLPDPVLVCSCNGVSAGAIRESVRQGCQSVADVKSSTCAGASCGGCMPTVTTLVRVELAAMGASVSNALCEHFEHSRRELYDLVRFHRHRTWADVVSSHGRGFGCEICRPTVASILASLTPGYVLGGDQAAVQDTNDHHLANMQRNGTYSVVPRVPGGEITADQLIELGQIAKDFDLYVKITGGQRVDLLGAQLHQLPSIWQRVVDAGMESGQAYGKSLRTVKSCVGSTWCRYGVQDSVGMAIRLEERYRGVRAPHKIKMGVSGCARECAEAQSKDVGVIATERGWNLYLCGNGGRTPRHADLFATDLDDEELVQAIDRFLMFYIRTADRLQRTSTWFEELEGGLDYLRAIVLEDSLGLADELDADMGLHVDGYECEWKATLADPSRLAHFVEFVNAPESTSTPVWVQERGQRVPA